MSSFCRIQYAGIILVALAAGCAADKAAPSPAKASSPAAMPSYPIALTDLLKMEDGQTPQAAYSPSSRYNAPAPNATPVAVAHYTPAAMQTPSPARWAPAATPATAAVRATPSPAPMAISPRKKPVDYDTSLVP